MWTNYEKRRECSPRKPRHVTSQIDAFGAPPSSAQLQALQDAVDRVQQGLNRLQTGLDSWSEEATGGLMLSLAEKGPESF